jgi:predicted metal-dependent HD superfamily phosphohydrolase
VLCYGTVGDCQQFGIEYGIILNPADLTIQKAETPVFTHHTTAHSHNTEHYQIKQFIPLKLKAKVTLEQATKDQRGVEL